MLTVAPFAIQATAYVLQVRTSANPNATVAGDTWLNSLPSFLFNTRPSCQPLDIPVGSQFFTNQTALTYTLNAVWQPNDTGEHVLSSLLYFNNILEDCRITSIVIDVEQWSRNPSQATYNMYGETVRSYIQCSIISAKGRIMFGFIQEYDYVPPDVPVTVNSDDPPFLGTNFLERDRVTKASALGV